MRDFMVQLGKDDLKGRHYPRGYAMWAVQHNKDWVQRIVTLRRSFHQSEPCEDQNKYVCQRPAAALEGSESLGKFHQGQLLTDTLSIRIQEVPTFRDFWCQKGITKFRDHEF